MKNFKKLIVFICLAGVSLFCVQSGDIPMHGSLGTGGSTKNPASPVEVFQNSAGIEVCFLIDLGDLCIEVFDQSGELVLQTVVKAAAGSSLPVNTSSWAPGEYTLVISDKFGGSLEGSFVIN